MNTCDPKTRGKLLTDVDAFNFDQAKYQPHDLDNDGKNETFCNIAHREYLATRGADVPPLLANDLVAGFYDAPIGKRLGWRELPNHTEAGKLAEEGADVVAVYTSPIPTPTPENPKPKRRHGHVVIVVPAIGGTGLHSAQAGSKCWNNAPLEKAGLPVTAYRYFTRAPEVASRS